MSGFFACLGHLANSRPPRNGGGRHQIRGSHSHRRLPAVALLTSSVLACEEETLAALEETQAKDLWGRIKGHGRAGHGTGIRR